MASIRPRILESGKRKYLVDFKDQQGKRRTKQFGKRKNAEAWMHRTLSKIEDGVYVHDSSSITVEDAGNLWLEAVEFERQRRPVTLNGYKSVLKNHICDENIGIGHIKLSNLTPARVKKFYQDLVIHKSPTTARKALKCLKSLLSEAQIQGKTIMNVALPVKPHSPNREARQDTFPTLEEVRTLLDASPRPFWKAFVYVGAMCGLRASEIRALTWNDIDFEQSILSIDKAADGTGRVFPPKSKAGTRKVPLPEAVIRELRYLKVSLPPNDLNLVFPNRAGKIMSGNAIYRGFWVKIMKELGFIDDEGKPRFFFHSLRHTAASLYIRRGVDPKKLSSIIGHSSIRTTYDLYGHLWEDTEGDRLLAAGIEKILFDR